jgi:hypothetical protein
VDFTLSIEPRDDFLAGLHLDTTVRASVRDCGVPATGGLVRAVPSNGDPDLLLADDGAAPDERADDGVYTATWRPGAVGQVRLALEAIVPGAMLSGSSAGEVVETTKYVMDDSVPFDWVDATAGSEAKVSEDDSYATLAIGFGFDFYGAVQKRVSVSSNGYVTFGQRRTEYANLPLPSGGAPDSLIAPYWDDLDPALAGRVLYLREGSAPNRRLTIQWDSFGYYLSSGRATFQVTLYERDGRIAFRYLAVTSGDPGHDRGASATVGIQDASGHFGLQHSFEQASLSDRMALEFRVDDSDVPIAYHPVAGRKLALREAAGRPKKRKLAVSLRDSRIAPPRLGSSSDPSRWGGVLRLRSPGTGGEAVIDLPPEGWTASKRGYRYRGTGACRRASIRRGRFEAKCRGAGIGLALREPRQGSIAVGVDLGKKISLCALFGGAVRRDQGTGFGGKRRHGRFIAGRAPRPESCPVP